MSSIKAIYQGGVFKPIDTVTLSEGSEVDVYVRGKERESFDLESFKKEVERIAALPLEGPDDGFSGADHDKVLYPMVDPE